MIIIIAINIGIYYLPNITTIPSQSAVVTKHFSNTHQIISTPKPTPLNTLDVVTNEKDSKDENENKDQLLASLQDEVANLTRQVHTLKKDMVVIQKQIYEIKTVAQDYNVESALDEKQIQNERLTKLETNFWHEPIDKNWENSTITAISTVLDSAEMKSVDMQSIECRANSCRIEFTNDEFNTLEQKLPIFINQLGNVLPFVSTQLSMDGANLIVYMSNANQQ